MIPGIENQEKYEQAVKYFVDKYWSEFLEREADAIDLESFYTKTRNDFNDRMNFLQNQFPIGEAGRFIFNWIYDNNSKKSFKSDVEILKIFCNKYNLKLQDISMSRVEFEAIEKVFHKAFQSKRNYKVKQKENISEFANRISNEENKFCKAMPIKFAIEHFNILTETNSNNSKPFLSKEQLISFINRAFLNDTSVKKITLNIGNGENYFVIKRFYEFYTLASNEFESTKKCKNKYIRFIAENFNNWSYEKLENNFANKTKRNW